MINKIYRLYIFLAFVFFAGTLAFADQSNSALDDKPSVDSAASSGIQVPAVPADTNSDTHTSYLYDLKKLIEKSRENIKEVNEKIKEQAVLKRNQKREERAHEYYEKGIQLTNEGKLDEARDYFEKAIRITEHPEMVGYIKESQRRLRKQEAALHAQEREHYNQIKQDETVRKEDVETAYKEAVDLYKQKKYHPAKDAFEHVDEIAPDYRATDSYLKIIDQDIVIADAVAAKQQAVEVARQQKEAEAARVKEKQMWLAQIEEKEKERKEAINKQAQDVYDDAVALYKNKKFAEAKKKFEEVSWVIPDYKATMKYLARIDRDAQQEKERVAREQQKALQEQRWEEEVERKKQEAQRKRELEVKERQHLQDLKEQAQFLYAAAVRLYDNKNMDDALDKFKDIEKLLPDYRSTRTYIARIEQREIDQQKQLLDSQKKAQEESLRKENSAKKFQEESLRKENSAKKAQEESLRKKNSASKLPVVVPSPVVAAPVITSPAPVPIAVVAAPVIQAAPVPAPVQPKPEQNNMPDQVKVAISLEDQQKQAQDIAVLAEKSAQLYRQIADVADDKSTVQTKRKMAQVDEILNNLKESKERLLRQMREEQWRHQQEESRTKQQERRAEAQKVYQDGLEYLRSHEYAKAKIKFLELENIIPDYKSSHRYLSRAEEGLKKASAQAVTSYEQREALHLKQLQDKQNIEEMRRAQEEKEKQSKIEQEQQAALENLTQKASSINDDIIRLSKQQDLEAMKVKFNELENTVTALTTLKDEMAKVKDRKLREKQLARETIRQHNKMILAQKREDQQIHAYYRAQPLREYRPVLSNQPDNADQFKRRDIMQEQNMLFTEGVDRYEHKKYTQAKLLFGELADQNDRRAEAWLKKVDRAITRELLRSQEGEEKERTAFLADQLKAQRELIVIQERERQRQKKLTEELEQQKRIYEDDRLLQLRKEETIKAQERERQRHEAKRLRLERDNEKQQAMLRFHKIQIAVKQPEAKPQVPTTPVPVAISSTQGVVAVAPAPALTAKQLQSQVDFSNKRKAFLDDKYKKEQQEQAHQAKLKAEAEARQKLEEARQKEKEHQKELRDQQEKDRQAKIKAREDARQKLEEARQKTREHQKELRDQREKDRQARIKAKEEARQKAEEARQKEKEHQKELREQREKDRQARIKAEEAAKAEQARIKAEKLAQEEKHRQEVLLEQEQQREEKIKQEEIVRQETQRRQEMERQEREHQAQLEAQREAVRKQLEDGVEAMYQEALRLYKEGDYSAAVDRFKDVQDILPGYKRSEQYMDEARQKSLIEKPQTVAIPDSSANNVSKALDLFDPNAK